MKVIDQAEAIAKEELKSNCNYHHVLVDGLIYNILKRSYAILPELVAECKRLKEEHCKDCCCAQSWKALGITEYAGNSIPEEIEALKARAENAEAEAEYQRKMRKEFQEFAEHQTVELKKAKAEAAKWQKTAQEELANRLYREDPTHKFRELKFELPNEQKKYLDYAAATLGN